MSSFRDQLKLFVNKKVIIKDVTNTQVGYTVTEVGKDYVIAQQNKNVEVILNLNHIVSLSLSEPLVKATKKKAARKKKTDPEWESIKRAYKKKPAKTA